MAADTGRNSVVHTSSRGGVVAVEVGLHACDDAWGSGNIVIVVGVVHRHDFVVAGPVGVDVLWWLVLNAQPEHRLAEDHLRGGNELTLARSLQHFKAVAGLVGRGAQVDALVCARLQLASLLCIRAARIRQSEHRAEVAHRWRSTCIALVRGLIVVSSPPAAVRHVGDQAGVRHGVLPVLLAGAATLVHHDAHGLLQRAHVALGRVLPRLVLAAVGVVHVEVLEHETDLGAVEYDLVVAV
eukprot:6214783-Pleurochrysis_carterae.AAC.2